MNIKNDFILKEYSIIFGPEYKEIIYDIVDNTDKHLSVYRAWRYIYKDKKKKDKIQIGIQFIDDNKNFLWKFESFEITTEEEINQIIINLIKNNNTKYYYFEANCIVKLNRDINHKNSFGSNTSEFLFKQNQEYVLRYDRLTDNTVVIVLYDDNIISHYFCNTVYPLNSLYKDLNHKDDHFDYLYDLYIEKKNL